LAGAKHREQDVNGTILMADDQAGLLEAEFQTHLIGDDVLHLWHAVMATNGVWLVPAGHGVVTVRVHHVQTALRAVDD
jgi:hypothetical protein